MPYTSEHRNNKKIPHKDVDISNYTFFKLLTELNIDLE